MHLKSGFQTWVPDLQALERVVKVLHKDDGALAWMLLKSCNQWKLEKEKSRITCIQAVDVISLFFTTLIKINCCQFAKRANL